MNGCVYLENCHKEYKFPDKEGSAFIKVKQDSDISSQKEINFKVQLQNFSEMDIDPADVYFFTIGKSPPHDKGDE